MPPLIIKVGGSLFSWPELGSRLCRWLDAHAPPETILVPGGGPAADVVRQLDRTHRLGEETAHWLALRAMTINAEILAALLPRSCVVDGPDLAELAWEQNLRPILEPFGFCESDESNAGALPHTWAVTSDSVAARVAVEVGAAELVLLKSAPPPAGEVPAWATAGYVDEWLPRVLAETNIAVRAVDFRSADGPCVP